MKFARMAEKLKASGSSLKAPPEGFIVKGRGETIPGNIYEGVRYSASHGRAVTFSCSWSARRQRQTT